jgi:hypothetical protein
MSSWGYLAGKNVNYTMKTTQWFFLHKFVFHHGKNGAKWDINNNFSEKTSITIAAKTILREDVIGKV